MQKHVQERKRKREGEDGGSSGGSGDQLAQSKQARSSSAGTDSGNQRNFRQQQAIGNEYGDKQFKAQPKLLSKVFALNKN